MSCGVIDVVSTEVVEMAVAVEVPFKRSEVGELSGFAGGMDGNSVKGGDAPGSLGTAGTIPTIPDACGA